MFSYLYKIYPQLFGNYKVLYMDTYSIYAKLNISHDEYLKKNLKKVKICLVKILVKMKQNVLIILLKNLLHYNLNAILILVKMILKIIKIN